MSRLVATIDLSAAAVGAQGSFKTQTPNACSALYIMNESAAFLQLDLGSNGQPIVQPWRNRLFYLPQAIQDVQWTVIAILTSASAPSTAVYVEAFAPNEVPSASLDGPVFRQSNIGNGSLPVTSTSQLINDGNPAATTAIEATPSGAPSSQLLWRNDGSGIFGGGLIVVTAAGVFTAMPAQAIPLAALANGLLPAGVIVSTAATLASAVGALDNGTGQLHSTVNARGLALGYNDAGGVYHQVLGVDGAGGVTTTVVPTLTASHQETGSCGIDRLTSAAGQQEGDVVNFKTQLAHAPTSITFTHTTSVNVANTYPKADNLTTTGFHVYWQSLAAGQMQWFGGYITVGN